MDTRLRTEIRQIWYDVLDYEYRLLEDLLKTKDRDNVRFVDVGCGSLGLLGRLGGRLARLKPFSLGIDIDHDELAKNLTVSHRVCASCYSLPLTNNSVDVIVCRWLFEHLKYPDQAMNEFARVLKKGGILYIKTPNLWNYAMIISWVTPTTFHNIIRLATGQNENTPTFYRANTERRLGQLAEKAGFAVRRLDTYSYSYMYYAFNKSIFHAMRSVSKWFNTKTRVAQQTLICAMEKVQDS